MAKSITLFRADAEYLVDLLDSVEPDSPESYMAEELSRYLRESFGMIAGGGTSRQPSQEARDAARYRWLRDSQANSLTLSRNSDHSCNYMTAAEWIDQCGDWYANNTEQERQAMADADTIWHLQIYPDTPIGSISWNAATLDAAIDAAMGE